MRIRPARLAALLLGKTSSPPFVGLNLTMALRLLRFAGAPIEDQYETINKSGGSSLWLEDFLEQLEKEESSRTIINNLITILVEGEGRTFWVTNSDRLSNITEQLVIEHLQKYVFESDSKFSNFQVTIRKEGAVTNNFNAPVNGGFGVQNIANDNAQQGGHLAHQDQVVTNSFNSRFNQDKRKLEQGLRSILAALGKEEGDLGTEIDLYLQELKTVSRESPEKKQDFIERLGSSLVEIGETINKGTDSYEKIKSYITPILAIFETGLTATPETLKHLLDMFK